jgi:hypothetical protein
MGAKKIKENINLYHTYDDYYNSNVKGLKDYLKEKAADGK